MNKYLPHDGQKTTIPKGTNVNDMTPEQQALWDCLNILRNNIYDWLGTVEECKAYHHERRETHYDITADLKDIESFMEITLKQMERFHELVRW